MAKPTPFKIHIPRQQLEDLKHRIEIARFPEKETPKDWSQGVPLEYLKEVTNYWKDDYSWERAQKAINAFDQFTLPINGLRIHYLHVRSPEPDALPLILTHGWPGSIVEFLEVIKPLCDPKNNGGRAEDAFDVICPSLPGYGFSDKPEEPGWGIEKIGGTWTKLMAELGYNKYVAQGGDWGSAVTTQIGIQDPEHCMAIHLNMVMAAPDAMNKEEFNDIENSAIASQKHYQEWDSGYSKQQSTRPQTIGYSLTDSPAGLAAWILEKFWSWTDCGGHPENIISRDKLLDNIMLYWLPKNGASSARLYWESFNSFAQFQPITIPTGCSIFPKEIMKSSRRWAEKRYTNIIHWNELDRGGHFAAFEQPELFVNELRTCFRSLR